MYPSVVLVATLMASFALRHPYLQTAYVALVAALSEQSLMNIKWSHEVEIFAYTSLLSSLNADNFTPMLAQNSQLPLLVAGILLAPAASSRAATIGPFRLLAALVPHAPQIVWARLVGLQMLSRARGTVTPEQVLWLAYAPAMMLPCVFALCLLPLNKESVTATPVEEDDGVWRQV